MGGVSRYPGSWRVYDRGFSLDFALPRKYLPLVCFFCSCPRLIRPASTACGRWYCARCCRYGCSRSPTASAGPRRHAPDIGLCDLFAQAPADDDLADLFFCARVFNCRTGAHAPCVHSGASCTTCRLSFDCACSQLEAQQEALCA